MKEASELLPLSQFSVPVKEKGKDRRREKKKEEV